MIDDEVRLRSDACTPYLSGVLCLTVTVLVSFCLASISNCTHSEFRVHPSCVLLSYTEPLCLSVVCDQILEEGHFPKQYLLQNLSIGEWTSQQVARWLVGIHLEHHIPEFTAQNVDGERLLQLETPELKVTYMSQSSQEWLFTFVFKVN